MIPWRDYRDELIRSKFVDDFTSDDAALISSTAFSFIDLLCIGLRANHQYAIRSCNRSFHEKPKVISGADFPLIY